MDTPSGTHVPSNITTGDRGIRLKDSDGAFPLDLYNALEPTLDGYPINLDYPIDNRDVRALDFNAVTIDRDYGHSTIYTGIAILGGLELPIFSFGGCCSIQLSYRIMRS